MTHSANIVIALKDKKIMTNLQHKAKVPLNLDFYHLNVKNLTRPIVC